MAGLLRKQPNAADLAEALQFGKITPEQFKELMAQAAPPANVAPAKTALDIANARANPPMPTAAQVATQRAAQIAAPAPAPVTSATPSTGPVTLTPEYNGASNLTAARQAGNFQPETLPRVTATPPTPSTAKPGLLNRLFSRGTSAPAVPTGAPSAPQFGALRRVGGVVNSALPSLGRTALGVAGTAGLVATAADIGSNLLNAGIDRLQNGQTTDTVSPLIEPDGGMLRKPLPAPGAMRAGNIVIGNPGATPAPVPANMPSVSFDVPPVQLPNGVTIGKTAQPTPLATGTTLNGGTVALQPDKPLELPANLTGAPALTIQRPDAQPQPLQTADAAQSLSASPFSLSAARKSSVTVPAVSATAPALPTAAPAAKVPAAVSPQIPVSVQTNAPGRVIAGRAGEWDETHNAETIVAGGAQQRNIQRLREGGATESVIQIKDPSGRVIETAPVPTGAGSLRKVNPADVNNPAMQAALADQVKGAQPGQTVRGIDLGAQGFVVGGTAAPAPADPSQSRAGILRSVQQNRAQTASLREGNRADLVAQYGEAKVQQMEASDATRRDNASVSNFAPKSASGMAQQAANDRTEAGVLRKQTRDDAINEAALNRTSAENIAQTQTNGALALADSKTKPTDWKNRYEVREETGPDGKTKQGVMYDLGAPGGPQRIDENKISPADAMSVYKQGMDNGKRGWYNPARWLGQNHDNTPLLDYYWTKATGQDPMLAPHRTGKELDASLTPASATPAIWKNPAKKST